MAAMTLYRKTEPVGDIAQTSTDHRPAYIFTTEAFSPGAPREDQDRDGQKNKNKNKTKKVQYQYASCSDCASKDNKIRDGIKD